MEQQQVIVRHIGQLLTMDGEGGAENAFQVLYNAALVVEGGIVSWVGLDQDLPLHYDGMEIDVEGALVSPGLVDAHTHLLYTGDRSYEVRMRAEGRTYLEILEAGGGILSTVEHTRRASEDELLHATRRRLSGALLSGTTTIEVKTGYDLTAPGEIRLLKVLDRLRQEGPWRVVPTAMGAHAVPPEFKGRPSEYLEYLIREYLPQVKPWADVVDIFCEPGVFSVDDARRYLTVAQNLELAVKLHIDELADGHGGQLAAGLGAVSADHCAFTPPTAFRAMADADVVAVVLPGTARYLNHGHMAQARAMIEAGGWVAIGSDGNPGSSPTHALSTLMPWTASWLGLTPEEVWTGVTRGGAQALRRNQAGRLTVGSPADFLVWDAEHYGYPVYYYGSNLVRDVYIGGRLVAVSHSEVL